MCSPLNYVKVFFPKTHKNLAHTTVSKPKAQSQLAMRYVLCLKQFILITSCIETTQLHGHEALPSG